MIMSVIAKDAINRFMGCCRSRGRVAMDRNTDTLPSRVTAPKLVLRSRNVVSSVWSQDERSVMFVSRSELFIDISFWSSWDLVTIFTFSWRRKSWFLTRSLPRNLCCYNRFARWWLTIVLVRPSRLRWLHFRVNWRGNIQGPRLIAGQLR